ncbi:MAG TPA: aminotransferase class I/II-fold pyridoxal phosphate-dependent enzyme [Candidatus Marinimicrobia bacterium]|nr:aminotransferase class I/II-fold pyridoxal phosphate-dependent enzyme [Candidatus Neomarinimicrobiota bacterium]HIN02380.1 aminotransferase class I/II-fold pyridoxal phosphate-dependent enzyme [Candidatus Neomarinimicrobiota bacterium]
MSNKHQLNTKLIHAGEPEKRYGGAVSMPIFQSSTFEFGGQTDYHDLQYIRLNNTPNHIVLHEKLAALEGAEAALVTASGMAAISASLLTFLKSGDHFLAHESLYGGTHDLINKDFPDLGIECDFIDGCDPNGWEEKLRSETKLIYVETITNPLLDVLDLNAVVDFAKKNNLLSLIDNTFASPVNYRPIENGFDLSLHSATKYLNGHTDIVAGAVIGSKELVTQVRHKLNHLGGSLDPNACFLMHRGIKTLGLRMERQNYNSFEVAKFLENHPRVARVNHPGLESSDSHDRANELLDGTSGMVSFEIDGSIEDANLFMSHLNLFINTASLGGVESLVTRPVQTSHSGMAPEERLAAGIQDELIRLSIGIEDAEDLIADLGQALEKI